MANKIHLEIITPSKQVLNQPVEMVTAPGSDGVFGVLANHTPFLTSLKIGELKYQNDGKNFRLALSNGFCEISSNKMTVLAEAAEFSEDIDIDRALKAKERAEKRLQEAISSKENINTARAQASLTRALTRIRVSGK
jgi:F-type H+-transporting ATPase subunit epsilon